MSSQALEIIISATNKAGAVIKSVQDSIGKLGNSGRAFQDLGNKIGGVGRNMTLGVTAPIVGGLVLAAKAAIDFEAAMTDTNRAVGASTATEMARSADMVQRLSAELGIAPVAMAGLVAEAGKLGVQRGQLEDYNRLVAQTGVAFDMSSADAGSAISRLTNVMGYMDNQGRVNIQGLTQLNSTIDYLADSGATSASAIVNVLGRAGGATRQFGLTSTAAAGMATAFLNMGEAPEVVGTALNGMLPMLQNATRQGDKFQGALQEIGISATQLEKDIKQDAGGAFTDLLDKLSKTENASGAIQDLFGTGADSAMLTKAVTNIEQFKKTMASANNVDASRLSQSFATTSATNAASLAKLQANFQILAINIGSVLLPPIAAITSALIPMVQGFSKFAAANPGIVKIGVAIALVAAAVGPALIAIGAMVGAVGTLIAAFSGGGILAGLGAAIAAGFLPVLAIVAVVAAGAALIIANWGPISSFFSGLFASIGAAIAPAVAAITQFATGFGQGLMTGLATAMPALQMMGGMFMSMFASLGGMVMSIGQFLGSLMGLAGAILQLTPAGIIINAIGAAFQRSGISAQSFGAMAGSAVGMLVAAVVRVVATVATIVPAFVSVGAQIVGTLAGIAGQAFAAGANIVSRIAAGIMSGIGAVLGAARSVASAVMSALPNSPVPSGPLVALNNISNNPGAKIVQMVAAGISGSGAIAPAMNQAVSPALSMGTPTGSVATPSPSAGGGGNSYVFNIPINGAGKNAAEIGDSLEERMRSLMPKLMKDADRQKARVAYG